MLIGKHPHWDHQVYAFISSFVELPCEMDNWQPYVSKKVQVHDASKSAAGPPSSLSVWESRYFITF